MLIDEKDQIIKLAQKKDISFSFYNKVMFRGFIQITAAIILSCLLWLSNNKFVLAVSLLLLVYGCIQIKYVFFYPTSLSKVLLQPTLYKGKMKFLLGKALQDKENKIDLKKINRILFIPNEHSIDTLYIEQGYTIYKYQLLREEYQANDEHLFLTSDDTTQRPYYINVNYAVDAGELCYGQDTMYHRIQENIVQKKLKNKLKYKNK